MLCMCAVRGGKRRYATGKLSLALCLDRANSITWCGEGGGDHGVDYSILLP